MSEYAGLTRASPGEDQQRAARGLGSTGVALD